MQKPIYVEDPKKVVRLSLPDVKEYVKFLYDGKLWYGEDFGTNGVYLTAECDCDIVKREEEKK
jgi:hypothetical protein